MNAAAIISVPDRAVSFARATERLPVAVLGGAFDPITHGHLRLLEHVEQLGFNVRVMPCGQKHNFGKRMLPVADRVELLELAVPGRLIVTEILYGTFRAADTYPRLAKTYGRVFWIIGSDNANAIHRWHDGARLQNQIPFIVIERAGHPLATTGRWCLQAPHLYLPMPFPSDISSTQARQAIAAGDWVQAARLVPAQVLARIRAEGWYRPGVQTVPPAAE